MRFGVFTVAIAVAVGLRGTGETRADSLVRFTYTLNIVQPPGNPVYTSYDIYADIYASPTSTNFLSYVNSGAYNNSIINRSVPGAVGGGGFKVASPNGSNITTVPANAAIPAQYTLPNVAGTISMVPVANSVTNQFVFNTADNSTAFGPGGLTASGYPVIGKILNPTSLSNLATIAGIGTTDYSTHVSPSIASNFLNFPLTSLPNVSPFYPYFVNVTSVTTVAQMGDINGDGKINIDDFLALDSSFLNPPASLQPNNFAADWSQGDLNLDGTVDATDVALLTAAYLQNNAPQAAGEFLQTVPLAVPEPGSVVLLAGGGLALLGSRRRRNLSI